MNKIRRTLFGVLAALPAVSMSNDGKSRRSSSGTQSAYGRSSAEKAAGVTPINEAFPAGDVRRYGALGDGTTDDTKAIQSALRIANFAQGTVLVILSAGLKFRITTYCQIFSNTSLHLFGELQLTGRQSGLFTNGANNVGIYGFKTGSLTDTSVQNHYIWNPAGGNIAPAIHIRSSKNVTIDGILISHCSQGVFVSNAAQNFVSNAAFTPTQEYPSFVRVQNSSFANCEWSGCATLSSYDSGYYGNYVYRCGDGGMWMMGSINGEVIGNHRVSPVATIADVHVYGQNNPAHPSTWNDVQGLEFENCQNLLISKNIVENIQGEAIDIKQGCNRVLCVNNRIVNSEQYSIVVREGDAGDVNACGKVSIVGNSISSHGFVQFASTPMGGAAAISVSSAYIVEIVDNVIHSYQTTAGIQCLGPGTYQSSQYGRNPQQASITITGNSIQFKGPNAYDKTEFPFTAATLGAIFIKGQHTSVACNNNHIRTDRYYISDDRFNESPAIYLEYVEGNGSFYPTSACISGNDISGWGSDGIRCLGLATMQYSGLNVQGNTVGSPGGYGIILLHTNYAACSNNIVARPNNKTVLEPLALLGDAANPLTGVVCTGNVLTGAPNAEGGTIDFCVLIKSAREINLSNNHMAGARKANLSTEGITGGLMLAGSTGFPREIEGNPNGSLKSYWRGEEVRDAVDGSWWKSSGFQSTEWIRL